MTITDEMVERHIKAAKIASCPGREGPFGLYDYTSYKRPLPHRVRDFRDPSAPDYGYSVFESDDRAAAAAVYERLTDQHIARAALAAALGDSVVVPRESDASLDDRMRAAGMIPLSVILSGETSLSKWEAHAGVSNVASFEQWLMMRYRELLRLRMPYELGDKDKSDKLYEWVLGNVGAFSEVVANWRAAKPPVPAAPALTAQEQT